MKGSSIDTVFSTIVVLLTLVIEDLEAYTILRLQRYTKVRTYPFLKCILYIGFYMYSYLSISSYSVEINPLPTLELCIYIYIKNNRRNMAEILPIRRKNYIINKSIKKDHTNSFTLSINRITVCFHRR